MIALIRHRWSALLFALCIFGLQGSALAESVFVFDPTSPVSRVFDSNTLRHIADIPVGFAAREAIRVEGGYAVSSKSGLSIFSESLQLLRVLPLPAAPADSQPGMAFLPEQRILAVATTSGVTLIRTGTFQFLTEVEVDSGVASLMVNPATDELLVLSVGGTRLLPIDVETLASSQEPILLPETPLSLPASASDSGWFGGKDTGYDVSLLNAKTSIPPLAVPAGDQFGPWLRRTFQPHGRGFLEFQPGREFAIYIGTSRNEIALPGETLDLKGSSDGRHLLGLANDRLFKYDVDERRVVLDAEASGARSLSIPHQAEADVIAEPRKRDVRNRVNASSHTSPQAATLIEITENPLAVNALAEFELIVAVFDDGNPIPDVPVQITFSNGISSCPKSGTTGPDGRVTVICRAAAVASDLATDIRFNSAFGNVTFRVTVLASTGDGLFKISGDDQIIAAGLPAKQALLVLASSGGAPQIGFRLEAIPGGAISCPSFVLTGADGIGRIQCSGGAVSSPMVASVNVGDGPRGSLIRTIPSPFFMRVRPFWSGQAARLELLSAEHYDVDIKAVIPNAVRVRALGTFDIPTVQAPVFYSSDESDVVFSPAETKTDNSATVSTTVTVGCAPEGVLYAGVNPGVRDVAVTYTTRLGPLAVVEVVAGDGQTGLPAQRLDDQALVVRASDACGTPIVGQAVSWAVSPSSAATLDSISSPTNRAGVSSAIVRMGNTPGVFTVTASATGKSAQFTLTVLAGAENLTIVSGDEQSVPSLGSSAPLTVKAANEDGSPVESAEIAFAVVEGTGTLSAAKVITDAEGLASVTVQAGSTLGPLRVDATTAMVSVSFNLTTVGRQPMVSAAGFVNGASFERGWTPGSVGSIFGQGLMEGVDGVLATPFTAGEGFPTTFQDVTIAVNGVDAPLYSFANIDGSEQINLQVPFEAGNGQTLSVVITNSGFVSEAFEVPSATIQPGIFQVFLESGPVAAALDENSELITPANPAKKGSIVQLFLTGLGPLVGPVGTNELGPVPALMTVEDPVVGIDHAGMEDFGGFYAPFLIGVYQVNFRVSLNVQSGLRDLNVVAGGVSSPIAKIPIE
jgi:uncharacterized protein (TIGR03437 family)